MMGRSKGMANRRHQTLQIWKRYCHFEWSVDDPGQVAGTWLGGVVGFGLRPAGDSVRNSGWSRFVAFSEEGTPAVIRLRPVRGDGWFR